MQPTFESVLNMVKVQAATLKNSIQDQQYKRIDQSINTIYAPDSLQKWFQSFFNKQINDSIPDKVEFFLNSKLYSKILNAEKTELQEDDYKRIIEIANYLETDSTLKMRKALIESSMRYEETQAIVDIYGEIYGSLLNAFRIFVDPNGRLKQSDIEMVVRAEELEFKKRFNREYPVEKLYRYKNLTQQELENYIAFKHSEDGKWLINKINMALLLTVQKANQKFIDYTRLLLSK